MTRIILRFTTTAIVEHVTACIKCVPTDAIYGALQGLMLQMYLLLKLLSTKAKLIKISYQLKKWCFGVSICRCLSLE